MASTQPLSFERNGHIRTRGEIPWNCPRCKSTDYCRLCDACPECGWSRDDRPPHNPAMGPPDPPRSCRSRMVA